MIKKFGPFFVKLQALYTERCIWTTLYLSQSNRYNNLQIYQLVGGFPANLLSSCISQNIFFHMIGIESFYFIF